MFLEHISADVGRDFQRVFVEGFIAPLAPVNSRRSRSRCARRTAACGAELAGI
jgi:hypothetical protein